jgi:hypothetical protein
MLIWSVDSQYETEREIQMSMLSRSRRELPNALRIELMLLAGLFLGLGSLAHAQKANLEESKATGTSFRAQLIGGWRLVSRQSRRTDGEPVTDPGLSTVPQGILIYDQSGHVAAQLSRRDRTVAMIGEECQIAATRKGTPDTAQTLLGMTRISGPTRSMSGPARSLIIWRLRSFPEISGKIYFAISQSRAID